MDQFLNIFFIVFHSVVVVFNLFGWIPRATRRTNLALLLATAFSWFGLGICYGWGYCFCTDWHWQVRYRLGFHDMPNSYIGFLIRETTGLKLPAPLVDGATLGLFLAALAVSLFLNVRDWRHSRAGHKHGPPGSG